MDGRGHPPMIPAWWDGRFGLVLGGMDTPFIEEFMTMNDLVQRFIEAYKLMATRAKYRPQAPGDGMGNVLLSREQASDPARLDKEAVAYARAFAAEDDERTFCIGCCDFRSSRAFVFVIEAARQLASGDEGNATAVKLLKMAIHDINR
jgi:hypothetical protein